jgi:hypothetical protein
MIAAIPSLLSVVLGVLLVASASTQASAQVVFCEKNGKIKAKRECKSREVPVPIARESLPLSVEWAIVDMNRDGQECGNLGVKHESSEWIDFSNACDINGGTATFSIAPLFGETPVCSATVFNGSGEHAVIEQIASTSIQLRLRTQDGTSSNLGADVHLVCFGDPAQ